MSTAAPQRERADPIVERELLERCDALVAAALARGAEEAEAFAVQAETCQVAFEKGDLKLAQIDESLSLGLRVFRGRSLGFAATNQADPAALAAIAEQAVALSRAAPPDPANVLCTARPLARGPSLVQAGIERLGIAEAVDLAHALVVRVQSHDARLSVDGAGCDITRASQAIATSRGARAAESDALVALSISGMALAGADVGGFHYGGDVVRDPAACERASGHLADEFARIAAGNLGAERAESYQGPVLFSPDAFLDLFVAPVLGAASAIAVQRGRSPLAARLGQRIAAPALSIDDEPHDAELAGAGGFDREGQPTSRFALVAGGVLQGWLYNGYAAAVEGRESTGHARGGARSLPGLGPHAVCVAGGTGGSRADLVRALGRGLLVQRFSGTVDPASGDFSGVAKSSRWIEAGGSERPVRETMLSGNAFALLERIAQLSTAAERVDGAMRAPWAIVDGVSVTAG